MGVAGILTVYSVGAGVLALWILVRFPSLGPTQLKGALLAMLVAWVGMSAAGWLFELLVELGRYGAALGLFTVFLPVLTVCFLTCGWMLRLLAGLRARF